jgi:hypothetical protein
MRYYMKLAVLALAACTAFPALSAPTRYSYEQLLEEHRPLKPAPPKPGPPIHSNDADRDPYSSNPIDEFGLGTHTPQFEAYEPEIATTSPLGGHGSKPPKGYSSQISQFNVKKGVNVPLALATKPEPRPHAGNPTADRQGRRRVYARGWRTMRKEGLGLA